LLENATLSYHAVMRSAKISLPGYVVNEQFVTPFKFCITTQGGQIFQFCAESAHERQMWIDAMVSTGVVRPPVIPPPVIGEHDPQTRARFDPHTGQPLQPEDQVTPTGQPTQQPFGESFLTTPAAPPPTGGGGSSANMNRLGKFFNSMFKPPASQGATGAQAGAHTQAPPKQLQADIPEPVDTAMTSQPPAAAMIPKFDPETGEPLPQQQAQPTTQPNEGGEGDEKFDL
jgi:hypothetical protein